MLKVVESSSGGKMAGRLSLRIYLPNRSAITVNVYEASTVEAVIKETLRVCIESGIYETLYRGLGFVFCSKFAFSLLIRNDIP